MQDTTKYQMKVLIFVSNDKYFLKMYNIILTYKVNCSKIREKIVIII